MVTLCGGRPPRTVMTGADHAVLAFVLGWLAATVVYGWAALAGGLA